MLLCRLVIKGKAEKLRKHIEWVSCPDIGNNERISERLAFKLGVRYMGMGGRRGVENERVWLKDLLGTSCYVFHLLCNLSLYIVTCLHVSPIYISPNCLIPYCLSFYHVTSSELIHSNTQFRFVKCRNK